MSRKEDFEKVKKYQKELILLGQANALLGWDEETYMPKRAISGRSEQTALLSKLAHEVMVSDDFWHCLQRLNKEKLSGDDFTIVKKLHKRVGQARKIPSSFVEDMSRATTLGSSAWRDARRQNKFKVFQPYLEKIISLKRKQAEYIGLPGHPYNSLLDDFEEGMTVEKLKPIFQDLSAYLVALLQKIQSSEKYKKQVLVMTNKNFPQQDMKDFCFDVVHRMGLETDSSRVDISEHPFTTKPGLHDVRVTINFRKDPLFSFGAAIHEAGHALYELGMPEKHIYDVLGDAPSLGLHESQSRFWENMIGLSKDFWKFYFPKFKRKFGLSDFERWFQEVNYVTPGFIRIESDEIHYCLHVILRFELELGLLDGSIKVSDLPKLWNSKMKELFGVVPKDEVHGVLQDVHWSQGYIGYFPTYALGTIYASQIYAALEKKHPRIHKDIERGNFTFVREWLRENIHRHGSRYLAEEVIQKVCGKGLDIHAYIDYLNKKYSEIYGF